MPPARLVLWLVLGTGAVRLVLAGTTGLGIDESYMVAAGRVLRLSYFDHPPLAWWLSRGSALLFGSEAPFLVRLPFVLLFAASTWLMFVLTRRLFGARAGVWAALGLNLSPVFSLSTGTWVLPDGPLVCALLGGAWALVRALDVRPSPRPSPPLGEFRREALPSPSPSLGERRGEGLASWLLAGLFAGLALLSKYSAALVLAGLLPYLLLQPTHLKWLRRPHPYAALAVALACCTPVFLWNARNHWISFAFQGGRAASAAFHPLGPLATLAGEALFVGPWVWLPLMLAWLAALRAGPMAWQSWLPTCLGALPVLLFVVVSFWARHVLYHWAAPGYLMLLPLFGAWVARLPSPSVHRTAVAAAGLLLAGVAALIVNAQVNPLASFGIDPGLQALDWDPLRAQLAARGLLTPGTVLAATNWQDAGKLDYGVHGTVPVVVLNPDAREYLFAPAPETYAGRDLLIIGPKVTEQGLQQTYGARFGSFEALAPLRLRDTTVGLYRGRLLH